MAVTTLSTVMPPPMRNVYRRENIRMRKKMEITQNLFIAKQ